MTCVVDGEVSLTLPSTILESLLLSVAHYWSYRESRNRQVELLERHFQQDEMLHALIELRLMKMLPPPVKRQHTASKTATKAQAEDVVDLLKTLGDNDNLARFMVQSDDLPRVVPLLGAVSVSDERSVGARLEALEVAQKKNMEEMKRMVSNSTSRQSQVMSTPDIVTWPTSDFATAVSSSIGQQQHWATAATAAAATAAAAEFLQPPSPAGRGRGREGCGISPGRARAC